MSLPLVPLLHYFAVQCVQCVARLVWSWNLLVLLFQINAILAISWPIFPVEDSVDFKNELFSTCIRHPFMPPLSVRLRKMTNAKVAFLKRLRSERLFEPVLHYSIPLMMLVPWHWYVNLYVWPYGNELTCFFIGPLATMESESLQKDLMKPAEYLTLNFLGVSVPHILSTRRNLSGKAQFT